MLTILKIKKIHLELVPDPDIYIFFEKATRGGTSNISNRYSKVNNRYSKSYDPKQDTKYIEYLVADSLFDYAMFKFLPRGRFQWIDPKEFDLNKYTSNSSKGCVLKVDLEYPKELLEMRNDCPLAPDKIQFKRQILYEYQLRLLIYTTFLLVMLISAQLF